MTAVRRTPEVVRTFIREATQQSGSNTKQALREHNRPPQKPGCRFTPSSLNKTCFCGEGLSLYSYRQPRLRSSRRPRTSAHPPQPTVHTEPTPASPRAVPVIQQ